MDRFDRHGSIQDSKDYHLFLSYAFRIRGI